MLERFDDLARGVSAFEFAGDELGLQPTHLAGRLIRWQIAHALGGGLGSEGRGQDRGGEDEGWGAMAHPTVNTVSGITVHDFLRQPSSLAVSA
ncbi:MAG: hypothetical protein R3F56_23520 [Planctomycetota bacterium]